MVCPCSIHGSWALQVRHLSPSLSVYIAYELPLTIKSRLIYIWWICGESIHFITICVATHNGWCCLPWWWPTRPINFTSDPVTLHPNRALMKRLRWISLISFRRRLRHLIWLALCLPPFLITQIIVTNRFWHLLFTHTMEAQTHAAKATFARRRHGWKPVIFENGYITLIAPQGSSLGGTNGFWR